MEMVACPNCRRQLRLPEESLGRELQCPACKERFYRPASAVEAPPLVVVPVEVPSARDDDAPAPRAERGHRRRAPQAVGRRRTWPAVVSILGGALVLSLCFALAAVRFLSPTRVGPGLVREDDPKARQDVIDAFQNQKPLDEKEIAQELRPLFENVKNSFRARDQAAIVAQFDVDRLLDELIVMNVFQPGLLGGRAELTHGLRQGLGTAFQQQAPLLQWDTIEIKHIKKLQGNEAAVIVRHRSEDGVYLKFRWWATKRSGEWKIYDMEDLDAGGRTTTGMAAVVGQGIGNVAGIARDMTHLRDALLAIANRQDPNALDAAERALRQIVGPPLPPQLEAQRLLVAGMIQLQRGQNPQALATLDAALRSNPEMPIVDLLKTVAYNNLNQPDLALKHIEAYQALLGDDATVCHELGMALSGLHRSREAATAFRKSLDYDPSNGDTFLSLLRSLTVGDPREDLGPRFLKLKEPEKHFAICAEDCRQVQDGESLEPIALAMRKLQPRHPAVDHYLALAKAWLGEPAPAIASFKNAQRQEKDAAKKQQDKGDFLQAMAKTGHATEVYAVVPDADNAFRILAAEMLKAFQTDELRRLVDAHRKRSPADPLMHLYDGELLERDGHHDLAEKAFTRGLAKVNDAGTLETFRLSRVRTRYHTASALAAYNDFGADSRNFQYLASLAFFDRKVDALTLLLDEHAKQAPDDIELLRYRFRLKIKNNQTVDGIALFQQALAKANDDNIRQTVLRDFYIDMVDAGKAVEGYQAAPEPRAAFQSVARDLLSLGRDKELRLVIAAHRRQQPDDSWLAFYEAELLVDQRDWDKAAALFRDALAGAAPEAKLTLQSRYCYAMVQAGKWLEAYERSVPRKDGFFQIANLLAAQKKGAELEALVNAHRPHTAPADPELPYYEARAKALTGRYAEAGTLLAKANQALKVDESKRTYTQQVVFDILDANQPLEAYRVASDRTISFDVVARQLLFQKKHGELAALVAEHAKDHAGDPTVPFYQGEIALAKGDTAKAEELFSKVLAKAKKNDVFNARQALKRTGIQAGKTAQLYQEAGPSPRTFEDLAQLCSFLKNPVALEGLLTVHRKQFPNDPHLAAWEVEILKLKDDHAGVIKRLTGAERELLKSQRHRWKFESDLVRGLVKLGRVQEAIEEAEAWQKNPTANRVPLIYAHAATGDVKQTIAAVEARPQRHLVEDCYVDPDLGPILRSEAFAPFRARYPEPKGHRDDHDD